MPKQPGLDGRHRAKDGEIRVKRTDTRVQTLRKTYGEDFLAGIRGDAKLGTVLKRTGLKSLSALRKFYRT